MPQVTLTINGQEVSAPAGSTLLDAARRQNINIPTMCHIPGHKSRSVCRICTVADEKSGRMFPACSTPVAEGMQIETDSADVTATRKVLMEMILAEHGTCGDQICAVEQLAAELGVLETRFQATPRTPRGNLSSEFVTVRHERCVHCDRCIQVCGKSQSVIARSGRGATVAIAFDDDRSLGESSCTGCGDCAAVCPAGGLLINA